MSTSPHASRLSQKATIITGAARGIGRDIARRFAEEGAYVLIADLDEAGAADAARQLRELGAKAESVRVDVGDKASVEAMIEASCRHFGRVDVLVNNAGIGSNKLTVDLGLDEWDRNLRVNLTGTFLCAQAAARVMVRQKSGRIVNIASISGQRGGVGRAAYGAAKAGVIQLTRVMAVELAHQGVAVNAVAPGPVDTEQSRGTHTPDTRRAYLDRIPIKRYGEAREIAAAVAFLASDDASFIVGHTLNVDGGFDAAGLIFDPKA
ncbi:MAG TPA: glucose 1-dehydrogenase [Opitutaceae bacterium]|nr:glucose 1-dehydrogenase [Opitutaceae bacterium]